MPLKFNPTTGKLDLVNSPGGESSQTYAQYVYDSTATQENNVYNDWSDLVDAIANGQSGQKTITFRRNGDTLPAGTWSLPNTTFAGNGFPPAAGGVIIDLADGFELAEVPSVTFDRFLGMRSLSSNPIMTISSLCSIFMKENTILASTTAPFFKIGNGAFGIAVHGIGALFLDEGAPIFDLSDSGGMVSAVVGGAVDLAADTVVGGASSYWQMFLYTNAPTTDIINVSQPNFLGTLEPIKYARADYTIYDNTASGLAATELQAAVDELAASGGGASGYSLQNEELTDTYAYAGYEHESNGSWYIYRRTRSNNLRQYATGLTDYATAWTNRASQVYS